jgi:hypothetical protein
VRHKQEALPPATQPPFGQQVAAEMKRLIQAELFPGQRAVLLNRRLLQQPQVLSVSVVDRGPWNMNGSNVMTFGRSPESGASTQTAYLKSIDADFSGRQTAASGGASL